MEGEIEEFELWLRRVRALAKDGNPQARHALWYAFNRLALHLARLAQSKASSINLDLLQGVLQHCRGMLNRSVRAGSRDALTYTLVMADELCNLIDEPEKRHSAIVADLKAKVSNWPTPKKTRLGRSAELAHMVFDQIRLYRWLLTRHQRKIIFQDPLTSRTEINVRIAEAKDYREVLKPAFEKLDADSYAAWWKVGKKILKRYWDKHPDDRKQDWATLGRNRPEGKTPQTYAISKVQKSFATLAHLSK